VTAAETGAILRLCTHGIGDRSHQIRKGERLEENSSPADILESTVVDPAGDITELRRELETRAARQRKTHGWSIASRPRVVTVVIVRARRSPDLIHLH
jgi:hypothetical protein